MLSEPLKIYPTREMIEELLIEENRKIKEVLGNKQTPGIDILEKIYEHNVPYEFSKETLEQVKKVKKVEFTTDRINSLLGLELTDKDIETELKKLGKTNVETLSPDECITVGDIELTAVFADHTVEAFGLIVKAENKTLYFSGDTLYNEKLFEIAKYKPDITFICINGRLGNMNVDEALITAKRIGAKINIPNHYDMFASNSENPYLFSENIYGGSVLEFNKEYEI